MTKTVTNIFFMVTFSWICYSIHCFFDAILPRENNIIMDHALRIRDNYLRNYRCLFENLRIIINTKSIIIYYMLKY